MAETQTFYGFKVGASGSSGFAETDAHQENFRNVGASVEFDLSSVSFFDPTPPGIPNYVRDHEGRRSSGGHGFGVRYQLAPPQRQDHSSHQADVFYRYIFSDTKYELFAGPSYFSGDPASHALGVTAGALVRTRGIQDKRAIDKNFGVHFFGALQGSLMRSVQPNTDTGMALVSLSAGIEWFAF